MTLDRYSLVLMWLRKVHYRNVTAEKDFSDTKNSKRQSVSEAATRLFTPFVIFKSVSLYQKDQINSVQMTK